MGHQKLSSIYLVTLTTALVLFLQTAAGEDIPKVECIGFLSDFEANHWTATSDLKYAKDASELPDMMGDERSRYEADGIFYLESSQFNKALRKSGEHMANMTPTYVYMRYSKFDENIRYPFLQPYGLPAVYYDRNYFEQDLNGFEGIWTEVLLTIQMDKVLWSGIELGAYFFQPGGIYLVDQIIVVQGAQFDPYYDVAKVAALCPKEPVTQPPPVTTENPSFVCSAVGYFADPKDCHAFHQCYEGQGGQLIDQPVLCPVGTVWCQGQQTCAHESVDCPCQGAV